MGCPVLERMYVNGERHIEKYGDVGCGSHAWLAEHKDTHTIADYLEVLAANQEWGPGVCAQMFTLGGLYYDGDALFELQERYASILAAYPFDIARGRIERVLMMHPLSPRARIVLMGAIEAHHPAAEDFLSRINAAEA